MVDKNRELLDQVIEKEIRGLSDLQNGSKEKATAVESLSELYKLKLEETKIEQAKVEKSEEMDLKKKQFKSQGLDRWLNFGLSLGSTLIGVIAYDVWHRRGLRFQESGSITNPETKNLMSKMLPMFRK